MILQLDKTYRSTWDVRTIAHVVNLSHETVAKVIREVRGPRPKKAKRPHVRRTKFLKADVMWSMDFKELYGKRYLIHTIDEASGYRLGWKVVKSPTAAAALEHMQEILAKTGRKPLLWKYDHGSAFTSDMVQDFLKEHEIQTYPIPPRAPWAQGRIERDHQEIDNWLMPVEKEGLSLEKEVLDGMLMLNFVKPRAVLGFRTAAEVYFNTPGVENIDRDAFGSEIQEQKVLLGPKGGERIHRKAVRNVLQKWNLYQEWIDLPNEAQSVNTSELLNVAN